MLITVSKQRAIESQIKLDIVTARMFSVELHVDKIARGFILMTSNPYAFVSVISI